MENPCMLSASTLAFVGDAVYGVLVRSKLAEVERPIGELHKLSVSYVNANAQCEAFELIKEILTEKEMSVFKRGRNNHVGQIPKSTNVASYHTATGLEALFGYLYITGEISRVNELFDVIWSGVLG
jgi:ribonuclease-3 family protein